MPSNRLILCCLFSSCLLSFPASGYFPVSHLLSSHGQNIGALASTSVLPMNIQGWFPYWLVGSPCSVSYINKLLLLVYHYFYKNRTFQLSHSVVSESLRHELQHARPPCLSPTPGVHSNSCPFSWRCHPAISSSVVPFSSCPNSSHHQSLFQWVNSSHEAKVLEFQL